MGGAEVVGELTCSMGSTGLGIWYSRRDVAASGGSYSLLKRAAFSSGMGEVLCSSPADSKREALQCHPYWDLLREPCNFGVLMLCHREPKLVPLTFSVQACSAWAKARVFSCLTVPEIPSSRGISVGWEILRTQPAELGWGIPPTQSLMFS